MVNRKSCNGFGLLCASGLSFLVFCYNIVAGKLATIGKLNLPHFGNTPEFLLLAVSVTCFIYWAMKQESHPE